MLDTMRMRTACFARAPQRCTSRLSTHFLLTFQEVTPLSKTRNQLHLKALPTHRNMAICLMACYRGEGFDHGAGHSLVLLYDAKAPHRKNTMEFKGLGDDPFNVFISLF